MKARVIARWWNKDLQEKFGEYGSVHDLPDDTETFVKEIAIPFGRVELAKINHGLIQIEFQNDYD